MKSWTFVSILSVLVLYLHLCFSFHDIKQKVISDQIAEIFHISTLVYTVTLWSSLTEIEWLMYIFHYITNYIWIRLYLLGPNIYNFGFWHGQDYRIMCQQLSPKSPPLFDVQCIHVVFTDIQSHSFTVQFTIFLMSAYLVYRIWESEYLDYKRIRETLMVLENNFGRKRAKVMNKTV